MKRVFKVLIILFVIFLVTGCGYSEDEKRQMNLIERLGQENALKYIEHKYNIKAEIEDYTVLHKDTGPVPDLFPGPTGQIYVTMSYKDKLFHVLIDGDEETLNGEDDYQYEEIKDAVINKLKKESTYPVKAGEVYYGTEYKYLLSDYYNGNNIEEIVNDNYIFIELYYINVNSLEKTNTSFLSNYPNSRIMLLNFNSSEDFDNFSKYKKNHNMLGLDDDEIPLYGIYIKDSFVLSGQNNGKEYFKYYQKKVDDIKYYAITDKRTVDLSLVKTDFNDLEDMGETYRYKKPKKIYNSYKVNNNSNEELKTLYIYLPKKELGKAKISDSYVGVICTNQYTMEKTSSSYVLHDLGDYVGGEAYISSCDPKSDINIVFFVMK